MGKHVVWWNAKLLCPQQPSAEIVRFERPNMWWNVKFFWARATLRRDRAGRTPKHVAKCKFGGARRSPKLWFESSDASVAWKSTAIAMWKLIFFNVRCKHSRIDVNLRLYPFGNVRHNRFARNTSGVKLRFYKVRRNPFTQNDCPTSKIAIFQRRVQPFRTIWWPKISNLRKIAIFWSV